MVNYLIEVGIFCSFKNGSTGSSSYSLNNSFNIVDIYKSKAYVTLYIYNSFTYLMINKNAYHSKK